jgi:hypothetical protein
MTGSEEIRQHFRILSVICMAILSGILIFAGVVWFLRSSGEFAGGGSESGASLSTVLNLAALSTLVVAHILPRSLAATSPGAQQEEVLATHKKATIVSMAIREGAALMALVGVLVTGEFKLGMAVAGLAVVLILLGWPRRSQIEGKLPSAGL